MHGRGRLLLCFELIRGRMYAFHFINKVHRPIFFFSVQHSTPQIPITISTQCKTRFPMIPYLILVRVRHDQMWY